MSPSIWTQCGGKRNAGPLRLDVWRIVESQYISATRKLTDSQEEQQRLEELLDGAKPPLPSSIARAGLHYLLSTPFRHPPLRNGSRFGTRLERGIFYGARLVPTALAEVAYYRLVFLEGTTATLGLLQTEHTAFRVGVVTDVGVDLTSGPFQDFMRQLASPTEYVHSQRLGSQMREDGVELVLFQSARDPERGTNVALFAPAFTQRAPHPHVQSWLCALTPERVEWRQKNVFASSPASHAFAREVFLVDGKLPMPAL